MPGNRCPLSLAMIRVTLVFCRGFGRELHLATSQLQRVLGRNCCWNCRGERERGIDKNYMINDAPGLGDQRISDRGQSQQYVMLYDRWMDLKGKQGGEGAPGRTMRGVFYTIRDKQRSICTLINKRIIKCSRPLLLFYYYHYSPPPWWIIRVITIELHASDQVLSSDPCLMVVQGSDMGLNQLPGGGKAENSPIY